MVRDEADVIKPMIEHHLQQGVDRIIVTDNGSIDGTTEILHEFGKTIDLRNDPIQRKQQHSVVTTMARDAYRLYNADWVINADADEFWFSKNSGHSLKEIFDKIDTAVKTFKVDVVDMTGVPARAGTGFQRLIYRDLRPVDYLTRIGLHAHSTPDAVHIGLPYIEVAQGNHFVNLEQDGSIPPEFELEVLHFPWRSWSQFSGKVEKSGKAYAANPDLQPSPNHHGMREYRRLSEGTLFPYYIIRHPDEAEIEQGLEAGYFVKDERLSARYKSPQKDVFFPEATLDNAREYGKIISQLDTVHVSELEVAHNRERDLLRFVDEGGKTIDSLLEERAAKDTELNSLKINLREASEALSAMRQRKAVRLADWIHGGVARRS